MGGLFEAFLESDRFGADPAATTPEADAAEAVSDIMQEKSWFDLVGVDIQASRVGGQNFVRLSVTTPNPLEVLEDMAAEVMKAAGSRGVSVQIQGADVDSDMTFVFTRGVEPKR